MSSNASKSKTKKSTPGGKGKTSKSSNKTRKSAKSSTSSKSSEHINETQLYQQEINKEENGFKDNLTIATQPNSNFLQDNYKKLFVNDVIDCKKCLWFGNFQRSPIGFIHVLKSIFLDNYDQVKNLGLNYIFYDQLLDHLIQLVDIMPMKVNTPLLPHRICLIDVVVTILINEWDNITLNFENGMLLFRRILKFARYSDNSAAAEAFRLVAKLHKGILGKGTKSDDDDRILKMVELVHPDSNIYPLAIHLAKTTTRKGSTDIIICSHIAEAHFYDQNDVVRIEELMLSDRPKRPLSTLQFLFAAVVRRKELAGVITNTICNVISRFKTSQGVKPFLQTYISTSFKFIFMAFRLGKYRWRRTVLLNLMDSLAHQKVQYLREEIAAHSAAVVVAAKTADILEGRLAAFAALANEVGEGSRLSSSYSSLPDASPKRVKALMWSLPSMDDPALKKRRPMRKRPPFPASFAMVYPKATRVDFPYHPRPK